MDAFLQQRSREEEVAGWEQGEDTRIFDYIFNNLENEHTKLDPDYKSRLKLCVFGYGGLTPARLLDAFKTRFGGKNYICFPSVVEHNASTDVESTSGPATIVPADLEALSEHGSGMKTTAFFNSFFDFFVDQITSVWSLSSPYNYFTVFWNLLTFCLLLLWKFVSFYFKYFKW